MNLYYALTTYQLLCVILHQIKFGGASDIMISDMTPEYEKRLERLEKSHLFKDVYLFTDTIALRGRIPRMEYSYDSALELIDENVIAVSKCLSIDLEKYDKLYICADQFPLGIYINSKKLNYYFFEEGNGQQSRFDVTIEHNIKNGDKYLYWIVKRLGLYGLNENVVEKFIDFESQSSKYEFDSKDVDFPVYKIIAGLSDKQRKKVLNIFDIYDLNIKDKCCENVLFCPQQNVNLNMFTVEQQTNQTAFLLDYFAGDAKVYIKPHPNDLFTDYTALGKKTEILQGSFPVELLLLCVDGKFLKGITAWSTSINSLKPILENTVCFTPKIDDDYPNLHRYYVACKMIGSLPKKPNVIYTLGANTPIVTNMLLYSDCLGANSVTLPFKSIDVFNEHFDCDTLLAICENNERFGILIDDLTSLDFRELEKLRDKVMALSAEFIIFINSKKDFFFFDGTNYDVFLNMIKHTIQKELLYESEFFSEIISNEEDIWMYTKDDDITRSVSNLSYIKELPYSKMLIRVNIPEDNFTEPCAEEVYRNIKMLEGILAATEQRVLSEIKDNLKLRKELDVLKRKNDKEFNKFQKNDNSAEMEALKTEELVLKAELELLEQRRVNDTLKKKIAELKKEILPYSEEEALEKNIMES